MTKTERDHYLAQLKAEYHASIERLTPEGIKGKPLFDIANPDGFSFTLTKELVESLQLERWLKDYRHEASHSTGGIRGPQNILYPWDTRFPINQMGIALATVAKALVLQELFPGKSLHKVVAGEVRYNTDSYIELISRLEAALGITVHQPQGIHLTTIWMASFIIFMNDYAGGEYVSSSHAVSSKTATKDLDDQGSQFLPEMSLAFVKKIEDMVERAKQDPNGYTITVAARKDSCIVQDFNGFADYAAYLRTSVATEANLKLMHRAAQSGFRAMFDTVGGCMFQNMVPLFKELGMPEVFEWHNSTEDAFFHGVGKTRKLNPVTRRDEFFDLSCDVSLPEVARTLGYEYLLQDKPIGYSILMVDPDGDRLVVGQVDEARKSAELASLGIDVIPLDSERIIVIYHPAFTFLLLMDFHVRQLKAAGLWQRCARFNVTTTPSPRSWDEWARAQGMAVVNTPVGIKEIAAVLKKVEKQLFSNPAKEVKVQDIWGNTVNLGKDPRLVFGGEESGGMIMGPEEVLTSRGGRKALAMREKSAGEALVIATALLSHLHLEKVLLSDYLKRIYNEYNIQHRCYYRTDITYYNESEPDPEAMRTAKAEGEIKRDAIDLFYLGLAMSLRDSRLKLAQVQELLHEAMPDLDFTDLQNVRFTGDASYLEFKDMFVQIRKSGTDAKLRGYANGSDPVRCRTYLNQLANYPGEKTARYNECVPIDYQATLYDLQAKLYSDYLHGGL